jgi:hypothetical protein
MPYGEDIVDEKIPYTAAEAEMKNKIDTKLLSLESVTKDLETRLELLLLNVQDKFQDLYERESQYMKILDCDELIKEAIYEEKNNLIQSLLDLISGKIRKDSHPGTDSNTDTINKIELLAVLEAWRKGMKRKL